MDFQLILTQILWYQWLLIAILFLAFAAQMFVYLYYYRRIFRRPQSVDSQQIVATKQPTVSVVICARNESENLAEFLPLVLEQDYPDYEVIVVNDGSSDDTETLLLQLQRLYPHLRFTHTPKQIDVISRKKLALTIGIKAAQNEFLLLTDADCRPLSNRWIAEMMNQFSHETDFVLGYGGYLPNKSLLSRLISFDTLFIGMQYLAFALRGRPYMGVGRNLAYRRSTFFAHRGFAGSLHIASGDDDLLINRFATAENTHAALTKDSTTLSLPKTSWREWFRQKQRHLSTSTHYTAASKRLVLLEPLTRGLFYALLVATLCFWSPATAQFALTLFLIRLVTQMVVINRVATQLGERKFFATIPIFDIILPIFTLFLLIFRRKKAVRWK